MPRNHCSFFSFPFVLANNLTTLLSFHFRIFKPVQLKLSSNHSLVTAYFNGFINAEILTTYYSRAFAQPMILAFTELSHCFTQLPYSFLSLFHSHTPYQLLFKHSLHFSLPFTLTKHITCYNFQHTHSPNTILINSIYFTMLFRLSLKPFQLMIF